MNLDGKATLPRRRSLKKQFLSVSVVQIVAAMLLAFACTAPTRAANYVVATNGTDENLGTAVQPFRTLQKAASVVGPGDTVTVKAGVYRGRTRITASGTSAQPITFQGETGAIIDGGDILTGWEPAPEMGPAVFKKSHAGIGYIPRNATWNNKFILEIRRSCMQGSVGKGFLTKAADDSSWDGVEARYGSVNDYIYLRFRNGENPNTQTLTFAPKQVGAITLDGADYIVIKNLTIRNAYSAIYIIKDATNNIIENNQLIGGQQTVYLAGSSGQLPARNVIRNNKITLDYVYDDFGHPWNRTPLDRAIWNAFKLDGEGDASGIMLLDSGSDNQIYGNHIYKHFDGIIHVIDLFDRVTEANRKSLSQYNQRLKIYNNLLEGMHDSGMEAVDGGVHTEWHDNIIKECTTSLRIKLVLKGPIYIYRNLVSNTTQTSSNVKSRPGLGFNPTIGYDPDSSGVVYFYHNTIAIGAPAMRFGSSEKKPSSLGLPNYWIVNNIFSSQYFAEVFSSTFSNGLKAHCDYNWAGGTPLTSAWPMKGHNVMAPEQTLWSNRATTDFKLTANSPARNKGIDLSKQWMVDGKSHPALPGMSNYYTDGNPDMGAIQLLENSPEPANPDKTLP